MAQQCTNCGRSYESTAPICPYCQAAQTPQQPAPGRDEADSVQVVTAPVRKKRTLPMSCMMGILIFAPTIFLVIFLMFFYFKQNRLREEEELRRNPVARTENTEKLLHKLSEAMEQLVLNARPELIESVRAESQDVLTITVKPEWNDLLESTRKDLQERWMGKWQQMDGKTLIVIVAETENPSVEGE